MLRATPQRLRCPKPSKARKRSACGGALSLSEGAPEGPHGEVRSGRLGCGDCGARYPILAGVAVVVPDVRGYVLEHVKGIAAAVGDEEIPRELLKEYRAARAALRAGHIHPVDDDLEAERVNALYLMNHYLRAGAAGASWWSPRAGRGSPLIDELVRKHWDEGPLARVGQAIEALGAPARDLVELGCGVGGLSRIVGSRVRSYLGVDSSFAGIALARHLALGMPYSGKVRIPEDLLQGPVPREIAIETAQATGRADFIVGDIQVPPLERAAWDVSVALNAIDMLEEPALLPELQRALLREGGIAIQSCPYIWHEAVAKKLRALLPREVKDSAGAVEWLYSRAGFDITESVAHVPWLFFKHVRQMEVYSVHLFVARAKYRIPRIKPDVGRDFTTR